MSEQLVMEATRIPSRESAATKARRYLAEGRLIVRRLDENTAQAECRGDGAIYRLGFDKGAWLCSCEAKGRCSHLIALGLVTALATREGRA